MIFLNYAEEKSKYFKTKPRTVLRAGTSTKFNGALVSRRAVGRYVLSQPDKMERLLQPLTDVEVASVRAQIQYIATQKPRSVNVRRQRLQDCMTVSGRIKHGVVPVPFTQGNQCAVKWVRDRTD